jgi:hypothetical protein
VYFVFRAEAESLAAQYWNCVDQAGVAGTLTLAAGRPEINDAMLKAWEAVAQVRGSQISRIRMLSRSVVMLYRPLLPQSPSAFPTTLCAPSPYSHHHLLLELYIACRSTPHFPPLQHPQVYQSSTLRASLLLVSDALLLLGLYNAGRLVGWSSVARNILALANGGAAIAALGVLALGAARARAGAEADRGMEISLASFTPAIPLLSVGGGLLLVSVMGLCASRARSPLLLRVYETCVGVALVVVLAVLVPFSKHGSNMLYNSDFITTHWTVVEALYPLSKGDAALLIEQHFYILLMGAILLAFLLALMLASACVLRRVAYGAAGGAGSTVEEKAGLLRRGEGNDEDEWEQQRV